MIKIMFNALAVLGWIIIIIVIGAVAVAAVAGWYAYELFNNVNIFR